MNMVGAVLVDAKWQYFILIMWHDCINGFRDVIALIVLLIPLVC